MQDHPILQFWSSGRPDHFFFINDVMINRKKLSKFLGEQENKYEYRSYTLDEISSLLSLCDERGKAIVLLMASTGMRVGALPSIKLKHLRRYEVWMMENMCIGFKSMLHLGKIVTLHFAPPNVLQP